MFESWPDYKILSLRFSMDFLGTLKYAMTAYFQILPYTLFMIIFSSYSVDYYKLCV